MTASPIPFRFSFKFFLTLTVLALIAAPACAEWDTYQGNAAHTGYVAGNVAASNLQLLWSTGVSSSPFGGIAVGGNGVYIKGPSIAITALNEQTGNLLWANAYPFGVNAGQVFTISAPAYSNGMVYYQTDNESDVNLFHGVNAKTGAKVYTTQYAAQWETYLNPTPFGANVYTGGGGGGGIYSYSAASGSQNWFGYEAQYDGWTPAVDGKYAYSFTGSGSVEPITGQFRMIDLATGITSYMVTDPDYQWTGYSMGSAVVLGSHNDAFSINESGITNAGQKPAGRLVSWSTQADATHTPHLAWVLADHYTGQPTLANGVLYVNDGGNLAAIDETTGNTLWTWLPTGGALTGTMVATDNILFAASQVTTYAIDLTTHQLDWSYPMGGELAYSDNTLILAGDNGTVYAFAVPEPSAVAILVIGALLLTRRSRNSHVVA